MQPDVSIRCYTCCCFRQAPFQKDVIYLQVIRWHVYWILHSTLLVVWHRKLCDWLDASIKQAELRVFNIRPTKRVPRRCQCSLCRRPTATAVTVYKRRQLTNSCHLNIVFWNMPLSSLTSGSRAAGTTLSALYKRFIFEPRSITYWHRWRIVSVHVQLCLMCSHVKLMFSFWTETAAKISWISY